MRTKGFNFLDSRLRRFLAKQSDKWKQDGPWRLPSIAYTLEHKLAFLEREHFLTGHYSLRGIFHDWEKPFLYLMPWLTEKDVQRLHRSRQPHHIDSGKQKNIFVLLEMYEDWDCAAITKPDKPLDAFATLVHFYPKIIRMMLPVCLAMDVERVTPKIFIHPWHNLCKDLAYNQEIYSEVRTTLDSIYCHLLANSLLWRQRAKTAAKIKNMQLLEPGDIFLLALYAQEKKRGREVSPVKTREIVLKRLQLFERSDTFIASPAQKIDHHYKKVKNNPYLFR